MKIKRVFLHFPGLLHEDAWILNYTHLVNKWHQQNITAEWLAPLFAISDVPSSNLDYYDMTFIVFLTLGSFGIVP